MARQRALPATSKPCRCRRRTPCSCSTAGCYGPLLPRRFRTAAAGSRCCSACRCCRWGSTNRAGTAGVSSMHRARGFPHRGKAAGERPCPGIGRSRWPHDSRWPGFPDESPLALVTEALEAMGADHRVFDQRRATAANLSVEIADAAGGGAIGGTLTLDGESIALPRDHRDVSSADGRSVPPGHRRTAAATPPSAATAAACTSSCCDLPISHRDACSIGPPIAGSNHSKPFQAQAIRAAGFDIPETLITNDPQAAREFIERAWSDGGGVIYKSVSGVRSIVQRVERQGPGTARADPLVPDPIPAPCRRHRHPGACRRRHRAGGARSSATPPTTATRPGTSASNRRSSRASSTRTPVRCASSSPQRLSLPLAGIDLRRTPDGRYVCFEVNPSPAFSFYERRTGLPIANCIARYLAGEEH